MAYIYHASIRSSNVWQAKFLAQKYHNQTFSFNYFNPTLASTPARMWAEFHEGDWHNYWTYIGVMEITRSGIADAEEADRATQFDNVIYGMLRNEPYFDFAITGVEPAEFRNYEELAEDFKDKTILKFNGLVVRTAIFSDFIGLDVPIPTEFQPFSKTHLWIPKEPVKYMEGGN